MPFFTNRMKYIVGIDEVGRGPLAGPVAVCAFMITEKGAERFLQQKSLGKLPLRDSKKLSKSQREIWFTEIKKLQKALKCNFVVSMVSAQKIDKIGIAPAIRFALAQSLKKLENNSVYRVFRHGEKHGTHIFLDGGLKAPIEYKNQQTIIKGDEKIPVISLASICAKVMRDNHMQKMAKKYPAYGFENHVGYGTAAHYTAIKKQGLTEIHRRSFLKNFSRKQ